MLAICAQVSLADLFSVTARESSERTLWRNRIDRKRVDFVLCRAATMRPVLAIELDDASRWLAYQVGELAAALREATGLEGPDFEIERKISELDSGEFHIWWFQVDFLSENHHM